MGARIAVIDFRYHIVSLIAVFLALALGLFLGSTTLQSTVTHNLRHQADTVTGENRRLEATNKTLSNELGAEQQLTAAAEPYIVGGKLDGETIAIVSAPNVASGDRKGLETTLKAAGATVTADVQLQSAYLDPTQDAELGALASAIKLPAGSLPEGNGATQASSVLAQILLTRPGRKVPSRSHVSSALSALADGKFISQSGAPVTRPAELAVLLLAAPSTSTTSTAEQAQDEILTGLAVDLRAASSSVVVAGPTPAPGAAQGAFSAARGDSTLAKTVSTV
jgi:Copper transport outer membrane protein, MctB